MNTQEGADGTPTQVSQADANTDSAWHHECEWTEEADTDIDLHRHYNHCPKNPGHKNFIPIGQFNIDHLPEGYRDEDIMEWTKLMAALTVKVVVRFVSVDRPETCPDTEEGKYIPDYKVGRDYPFAKCRGEAVTRTGTAYVWRVYRYKSQCKCEVHCPHKDWGKVVLRTARHVVYDHSEAEKSELIFHYDSEVSQEEIRTELGRGVDICSTEEDVCYMYFYSHDVKFLDWLEETLKQRQVLKEKLFNKYIKPTLDDTRHDFNLQYKSPQSHLPVIIVSHPHGRSKMVSMGKLTEVLEAEQEDVNRIRHVVYNYSADTCPGSSGAWVFYVGKKRGCLWESEWELGFFPSIPHSRKLEGGLNRSAATFFWRPSESGT